MAKSLPSTNQLERALEVTRQIEKLQEELAAILGGSARVSKRAGKSADKPARKTRIMSPEAKEKIAAAQRLRWAKQKKADKKG